MANFQLRKEENNKISVKCAIIEGKENFMAKVAVFLAPGFEEIEALTVVDYLRRANVNVTTVSVPESRR